MKKLRRAGFRWDEFFHTERGQDSHFCTTLGLRTVLLEWTAIFLAVLAFCWGFLDLGTQRMLTGNEIEAYLSTGRLLLDSLANYGQFPLWNPYLRSGEPFVAETLLYIYNPVVTIPILLFDVVDGFKIGLWLSYLAAGLGMWWLGAVLGVGRAGRLWMALMFAFSGPMVARFFQGQYLLVQGAPWIVWTIASLIAAVRTRRPLHTAMAATSLALLYLAGHLYYSYYMLFVLALFVPSAVLGLRRARPHLVFHGDRAKIIVAVGLLAAGLTALSVLPTMELLPHLARIVNPQVNTSHTMQQIVLDYTSKDPRRPDALKPWLQPEEYYAYVGFAPLLGLLLLPLALRRKERRWALFLILMALYAVAWIGVQYYPWGEIYSRSHWLHQFRYPTRLLIFGACALIALTGMGMDSLWEMLRGRERPRLGLNRQSLAAIGRATALGALVGVLLWSVADVYSTNRQHAKTRDPYLAIDEVMGWLRGVDPGEYFAAVNGDWFMTAYKHRIRFYNPIYWIEDLRPLSSAENVRPVNARPNYWILDKSTRPNEPDAVSMTTPGGHNVWKMPRSLPYTFSVRNEKLMDRAAGRELEAADVTPQVPFIPGPNGVEVVAQGETGSTLVVLTALYPGWEVTVDGRKQPLRNIGGYLATDMQPGVHKYVFAFSSLPFAVGLPISLLALAVVLLLVLGDLQVDWRRAWARARSWRPSLEPLQRIRGRLTLPGRPTVSEPGRLQPALLPRPVMVEAVYEGGVLRPLAPLDLPENSRVRLAVGGDGSALGLPMPAGLSGWLWNPTLFLARLASVLSLEWVLFGATMLVYTVTRLWALEDFPIYFFCDEAIEALTGERLLDRGFRDAQGALFPVFFEPAPQRWVPQLSVYFNAIAVGLFGKSIVVTRATSALVTVFGVAGVALILKLVFRARFWWAGALIMGIIPAWFIHSRTAFNWVTMTTFYVWFLLFYLLYRTRSPRYLFPAILLGAAAFYTYNTQAVVASLAVGLFLSDIRYHLRQWRTVLPGLALVGLLALPLVGFRLAHPTAVEDQLRVIGSYWFQMIPLQEKLGMFAQRYLLGLSPQYWFFPNGVDLVRHIMKGYGHIRVEMLPFWALGVAVCLWRIRSSPHRAVLLATLAVPTAAAMAEVGVGRVLAFVAPASILIVLGLEALLRLVPRRVPPSLQATALFALLALTSVGTLRLALAEGPTWFRDYGLYGLQWGAKQLFQEAIPEYLRRQPDTQLFVSPNWANGADSYLTFFFTPAQRARIQMPSIDYFLSDRRQLTPNTLVVAPPEEYQRAQASGKFKSITVDKMIPYPDGRPGFHFLRLAYADDLDARIAAEREARRQLVEGRVTVDGETVTVRHSRLDMGTVNHMFDGDRFTLARGMEANPFVLEFTFAKPRPLAGLAFDFGSMEFVLTTSVYGEGSETPTTYTGTYRGLPPDPHVEVPLDRGPEMVTRVRVEIRNLLAGDTTNIHVREVAFK